MEIKRAGSQPSTKGPADKDVMTILHYGEESVSIAIEEVESQDWAEKSYKADVVNKWKKGANKWQ